MKDNQRKAMWAKRQLPSKGFGYRLQKGSVEIQVAKYRGRDSFDKAMGNNYNWHDKYYVDDFRSHKEKLFKSKQDAELYAKRLTQKYDKSKKI